MVSSVQRYECDKFTEYTILPDVLLHANLDILKQFIVCALFSINTFRDQNRLQSCKAKDNAGSKPAYEDGDKDLDYIV